MTKIRAIIKRPDELYGHMTNITHSLQNLQKIVGGYIEAIPLRKDVVILVNEFGKIQGLDFNIPHPFTDKDFLVGTLIVLGVDGEEFGDLPADFEMSTWKEILAKRRKGDSI